MMPTRVFTDEERSQVIELAPVMLNHNIRKMTGLHDEHIKRIIREHEEKHKIKIKRPDAGSGRKPVRIMTVSNKLLSQKWDKNVLSP